jgi:hypothetical protein
MKSKLKNKSASVLLIGALFLLASSGAIINIKWTPRYKDVGVVGSAPRQGQENYEPFPYAADFNLDGLPDLLLQRSKFQTHNTYPVDILLNNGKGGFDLATSDLFEGDAPLLQNPRKTVFADFNRDGFIDFYIADHGYDVSPHPGFQNTLVLSNEDGRYFDATANLPQQSDFTHDVSAGDLDGDGDVDLYVGNIWGMNKFPPYIALNDGYGKFTKKEDALPELTGLSQNGFTTSEMVDVDNDDDLDLVLGDAGDDINNEFSTPTSEILLNDGEANFTHLPDAMPPKSNARADICHDIHPFDLNGDDYPDLFVVYERQAASGSYIQALVNNGDGTFSDETDIWLEAPLFPFWLPSLEMRDLNRDGHPDLVARNWNHRRPNPVVFMNSSDNFFSHQEIDFRMPYLYYEFLDMEGDGENDLVYITVEGKENIRLIKDRSE